MKNEGIVMKKVMNEV